MVLIRHMLTVRMHIKICLVDCAWGQKGPKFKPCFLQQFQSYEKTKSKAHAVSGNNNFWTRGRVKVACHFPFWERTFYVIFALGSESSVDITEKHGCKVTQRNYQQQQVGTDQTKCRLRCYADIFCLKGYSRTKQLTTQATHSHRTAAYRHLFTEICLYIYRKLLTLLTSALQRLGNVIIMYPIGDHIIHTLKEK